jgi:hypothetical protein
VNDPSVLTGRRIGFVSTRFAGADGVSFETAKWAEMLKRLGRNSAWAVSMSDKD